MKSVGKKLCVCKKRLFLQCNRGILQLICTPFIKRHHFYCNANKNARVGSDLRADRCEWQSEMKARNCALRANIAQCLRLSIRAVRPERKVRPRSDPTLGFRACMVSINRQPVQQFSITLTRRSDPASRFALKKTKPRAARREVCMEEPFQRKCRIMRKLPRLSQQLRERLRQLWARIFPSPRRGSPFRRRRRGGRRAS